MICPQTKQECSAKYCVRRNICFDKSFRASAKRAPPPPTLAEIERLVDAAMRDAMFYQASGSNGAAIQWDKSKAALMAAIQRHIQE